MAFWLHRDARAVRLARRFAADRRGITAVITALGLTVLFGFGGLAVDVAAWLQASHKLQAAADQGAYSAAAAAGTGGCPNAAAETQATAVIAANGYIDGQHNTTVKIKCDSSSSDYTVTISQQQPLWFTNLFLSHPPTATASAKAMLAGKQSDLCILALDGTDFSSGVTGNDANAFWLNGNTTIDVHCGVAVDSTSLTSLSVGGSSSLTGTDIYLVGDDQGSPSGSGSMTTAPTPNNILKNQRPVADPYAGRVVPQLTSCGVHGTSGTTVSASGTINPGVYCGGLSIGGNSPSSVTVAPGIYYIVGGSLTFNSKAQVTANGVTFVLTGGMLGQTGYATVTVNGSPQSFLHLVAPTSGPTGGMAFFQDRNAPFSGSSSTSTSCGSGTSQNQINGGSNQLITGAIYFPNQSVCYGGGASTTGAGKCTQLIAHTLSFSGDSEIDSDCAGTGVSSVSVTTPTLVQ